MWNLASGTLKNKIKSMAEIILAQVNLESVTMGGHPHNHDDVPVITWSFGWSVRNAITGPHFT